MLRTGSSSLVLFPVFSSLRHAAERRFPVSVQTHVRARVTGLIDLRVHPETLPDASPYTPHSPPQEDTDRRRERCRGTEASTPVYFHKRGVRETGDNSAPPTAWTSADAPADGTSRRRRRKLLRGEEENRKRSLGLLPADLPRRSRDWRRGKS